jgi:FMN-dependent oxidoreductase (nitrilotriacetate monooxygenase family)
VTARKRIRLHGLRQSAVGHTAIGLWRHPDNQARRYRTLSYWLETARILERGRFDALFIADALGPLEVYQGKVDAALRDGIQTPTDDPLLLISAMAAAAPGLGFAVTVSSTYERPYQFARKMTTLDHLTDGRIGWNIVTSALDSAARNLGLQRQIPHDERYAIAEEFMEVVYKLWEGSWEDDAVVADAAAGVFADPSKVHPVAHRGSYFDVPGIALSESSRQRTPVLYQAGTSPAGKAFAARHAEGVFLSTYKPEMARRLVDDIRAQADRSGRDPQSLKFLAMATVIVAETDELAVAKEREYRAYASLEGSLARYSALMNIDLSALAPDEPLEYAETEGIRGVVENFTRLDPTRRWTPRSIAEFVGLSGGAPLVVGSPATVSDELERWVDEADIDGFNITDPVAPQTFRDFVDLVVPELQARGRVWREYDGETLRERFHGAGQERVRDDHPAAAHRFPRPAPLSPSAGPSSTDVRETVLERCVHGVPSR